MTTAAKREGLGSIRSAYNDIALGILQADALPGVDEKRLKLFKEKYSSSVIVCRAKGCLRGLNGFTTNEERDEHETLHRLDLRCPYEDCPMGKLSFSSARRRKAHLKQCHEEEPVRLPAPKQPGGIVRADTEATLVEGHPATAGDDTFVTLPPWSEEPEVDTKRDNMNAVFDFLESDQFALQTSTG